MLREEWNDGLQSSWSAEYKRYMAEPEVATWYNGREKGYVVTLSHRYKKTIVIAFFENRSSDSISVWQWYSNHSYMNPPTIRDLPDNYSCHEFMYGDILGAARHVKKELASWYDDQIKEAKDEKA